MKQPGQNGFLIIGVQPLQRFLVKIKAGESVVLILPYAVTWEIYASIPVLIMFAAITIKKFVTAPKVEIPVQSVAKIQNVIMMLQ